MGREVYPCDNREGGLWGSRELGEGGNEEAARAMGLAMDIGMEAVSGSPSDWPLAELVPWEPARAINKHTAESGGSRDRVCLGSRDTQLL